MIIAVTLERKTTDEVARSELRLRMEIWLETGNLRYVRVT